MTTTRDRLNAFLDLPEVPVSNAQSGPLSGLTFGVKDLFDVAGYVTGCGNAAKAAEATPATASAPAVQALLDAGARFAGKTQTEELAFSLFGQNVHFPWPVNPAAPDRVTGGSSSGSAAAVAAGLCDIALGSDTGGSVRAPAAFCGLIGLRTTHGAIALDGVMPLASSFDTVGWFARDIDVYEKVGEVLLSAAPPSPLRGGSASDRNGVKIGRRGGGSTGADPEGSPPPRLKNVASQHSLADPPHKGEGKLRPLRFARLDALSGDVERAEYARIAAIAADVLGTPQLAAPLSFDPDHLYHCFRKLQACEAWRAHGAWISEKDRGMAPAVRDRFEAGRLVDPAMEADERRLRADFRAALLDVLGDDSVIVMPTMPTAAPLSRSTPEQFQAFREQALARLCWSGLSGCPQITLPLGKVHGAPFGLSLLGPPGSDRALIGLGRKIMNGAVT